MRSSFLDIEFDVLSLGEVLRQLETTTTESPFAYIVTPNVDHVVKIEQQGGAGLRPIYRDARFCLCDSRILRRLARFRGIRLPVVTGSDLTRALFENVIKPGDRIAVVGGNVALLKAMTARFPRVMFVHHEPPMGLLNNAPALDAAARFVVDQGARFTFLAVGFPQQELLAARVARASAARGTALCIGAALEFLTRQQKRAPAVIRRLGFEWAYRLSQEPARLWRRYLLEGPAIFRIAWRWRKA